MKSPLFRILGGLVLLASCLFLVWQVKEAWRQLTGLTISSAFIWSVAFASVVYTGMLSLHAAAWWRLLQALVPGQCLPLGKCWRVFMRTQAPKYLPGNIFHYLARIELLADKGISRATVMLSLLHEIFLLAAAALFLGAVGLWQTASDKGGMTGRFGLVAVFCLAALLLLWFFQRRRTQTYSDKNLPGRTWLAAGALYALFFLLMAAILWFLAQLTGHALPMALCLAAATVPWLLGFVTPGAPGGLGVREAAMLILLRPVMPPADGLLLVMTLRMVTLLGDLAAFPLSYAPRLRRGRALR